MILISRRWSWRSSCWPRSHRGFTLGRQLAISYRSSSWSWLLRPWRCWGTTDSCWLASLSLPDWSPRWTCSSCLRWGSWSPQRARWISDGTARSQPERCSSPLSFGGLRAIGSRVLATRISYRIFTSLTQLLRACSWRLIRRFRELMLIPGFSIAITITVLPLLSSSASSSFALGSSSSRLVFRFCCLILCLPVRFRFRRRFRRFRCKFLSLRLVFIAPFIFWRKGLSFPTLFAFRGRWGFGAGFLMLLSALSIYHSSILGFSVLYPMIAALIWQLLPAAGKEISLPTQALEYLHWFLMNAHVLHLQVFLYSLRWSSLTFPMKTCLLLQNYSNLPKFEPPLQSANTP